MDLISNIIGAFVIIVVIAFGLAGIFAGIEYLGIAHHGTAILLSFVIESIIASLFR